MPSLAPFRGIVKAVKDSGFEDIPALRGMYILKCGRKRSLMFALRLLLTIVPQRVMAFLTRLVFVTIRLSWKDST